MIDSHQRVHKVKLSEEFVHSDAQSFKRAHSVIVLNQLVMRTTHPREAENIAECWVDEH